MISTGALGMIGVGLWVILMVSAYERKGIRIPIVSRLAEVVAGKPHAEAPIAGS